MQRSTARASFFCELVQQNARLGCKAGAAQLFAPACAFTAAPSSFEQQPTTRLDCKGWCRGGHGWNAPRPTNSPCPPQLPHTHLVAAHAQAAKDVQPVVDDLCCVVVAGVGPGRPLLPLPGIGVVQVRAIVACAVGLVADMQASRPETGDGMAREGSFVPKRKVWGLAACKVCTASAWLTFTHLQQTHSSTHLRPPAPASWRRSSD